MNYENKNMKVILKVQNDKDKKKEEERVVNNCLKDIKFSNENENENIDSSLLNIYNLINKNTKKTINDLTNFSFEDTNKIKDFSMDLKKKKVDDSEIKTKKLINSLNKTKIYLQNKLNSIQNNGDLYLNESYQNIPNLKVENNIRKYNINKLKNKENIIKEKFSELQNQIELIIEKENNKGVNRKKNIIKYLEK